MKKILIIAFDYDFKWISNKQKIQEILENPHSPELLIIFQNESNKTELAFLTDLQYEMVSIENEIVQIPE